MQTEDLENITASCGAGPKGQKTWFNILKGAKGKFGTELLINITQLKAAVAAGCHKFVDKNGDTLVSLRPKIWPAKGGDFGGGKPAPRKEEPKKLGDILDDEIGF